MTKKIKRQSDVVINNNNIIKYLEKILNDNDMQCDINNIPASEYMQGINDTCELVIEHIKDINSKLK